MIKMMLVLLFPTVSVAGSAELNTTLSAFQLRVPNLWIANCFGIFKNHFKEKFKKLQITLNSILLFVYLIIFWIFIGKNFCVLT